MREWAPILLAILLSGCAPFLVGVPNENPGGIGFGEELFKLQGKVDYLYVHVQRSLKKLELQVGDLQRSAQNSESQSELVALRGDLLRLRDELRDVRENVKSFSAKSLLKLDAALREEISELRREMGTLRKQIESLAVRVSETGRIDRISKAAAPGQTESLPSKTDRPFSEAGWPGGSLLLEIYFPDGSSEVTAAVKKDIALVAAKSLKEKLKLSVVGFVEGGSTLSDEQYRAVAVRSWAVYNELLNAGVHRDKVSLMTLLLHDWKKSGQKVEIRKEH